MNVDNRDKEVKAAEARVESLKQPRSKTKRNIARQKWTIRKMKSCWPKWNAKRKQPHVAESIPTIAGSTTDRVAPNIAELGPCRSTRAEMYGAAR